MKCACFLHYVLGPKQSDKLLKHETQLFQNKLVHKTVHILCLTVHTLNQSVRTLDHTVHPASLSPASPLASPHALPSKAVCPSPALPLAMALTLQSTLYVIHRLLVCLSVCHTILRLGQQAFVETAGPLGASRRMPLQHVPAVVWPIC